MAHHYETNVDEIGRSLIGVIESFGFTSTHEGKALGELIVDEVVGGIQARSAERQCGGVGPRWPINEKTRYEEKQKRLGVCLTNFDTGQMLSAESLKGKVRISQNLVEIEYGTGEAADVPDRLPATHRIDVLGGTAKEPVTDIDKATYAAEQGRGFFELDDEICDETFKAFSETLSEHIRNQGR